MNLKMTFKSIGFLTVPLHSKLFLAAKVFVHRKIAFTQVKIYSISKLESLKSFSEQEKVYLEFFLLKCFLFCSKKKKCKISYEKLCSLRHVSVTTKFVYLNGKKMSSKTIIVALNVRLLRFMVSFQKTRNYQFVSFVLFEPSPFVDVIIFKCFKFIDVQLGSINLFRLIGRK